MLLSIMIMTIHNSELPTLEPLFPEGFGKIKTILYILGAVSKCWLSFEEFVPCFILSTNQIDDTIGMCHNFGHRLNIIEVIILETQTNEIETNICALDCMYSHE